MTETGTVVHRVGSTLEHVAGDGEEVRRWIHERCEIARAAERRLVACCARSGYGWLIYRGQPVSEEEAAFLLANR